MSNPEIVIARHSNAPFPVEFAVFEEDTYLVLSAGNVVRETREETSSLVYEMMDFEPQSVGSLVVKGNRGYAIVHDLAREPSHDPAWVDAALAELAAWCHERGIRSLAIEPIGCVHARGDLDAFVGRVGALCVERIWIMFDANRRG
ncbi:MAG: hypothetical protein KDI19_09285 [Pseudomonadales bacterium]|nr:hypothetical protein [Pseudomonadales bacterium]